MIKLFMNRQNWKMLLLCLTAPLVFTACGGGDGGGSSTADGAASATPGRMPDTNQTTSYTNTFGEDSDYTINPPSYTDNGNGTVTDKVTGFIWQKHDDGVSKTWDNAATYCNNLTLAGQTDWRLPSQIELVSIIDNGVYEPSINTAFFPITLTSDYWSSTTSAYNTSEAGIVLFNRAGSNMSFYDSKTNTDYVRCVRGGQTTPSLTDNGNGTVTDSGTLLTWQQGESSAMTWEAALTYCEGLSLAGSTDWRLPNHKELLSLVDYTRYNPSINTTFFPSTLSRFYWSSTTNAKDTEMAWDVYFSVAYSGGDEKASSNYVRCVRSKSSDSPTSPSTTSPIAGTWKQSTANGVAPSYTMTVVVNADGTWSYTLVPTTGTTCTADGTSSTSGNNVTIVTAANSCGTGTYPQTETGTFTVTATTLTVTNGTNTAVYTKQ